MKLLVRFVQIMLLAIISQQPASAHNVYSSFTHIEWNTSDNSIELVIELHAHELEAKLSVLLNERLTFLEDSDYPKLETATADYIPSQLQLHVDGTHIPLTYLGMENEGQVVKTYLEADLLKAPENITFMNGILIGDLPGQVNTVVAIVNRQRKGGEITADTGPVNFTFK